MSRIVGLGTGLATLSLLVAGCGGPSATDYRAALDKQCAEAATFSRSLPSRHLSATDATALAERHAQDFNRRVAAIDAPDDLAGAQSKLVGVLRNGLADPPTTTDAAHTYLAGLLTAYRATGAPRCISGARTSLTLFEKQTAT